MNLSIQAVRGMHDIIPSEAYYWQRLETVWQALAARYGYQEIRLPIVEIAPLFQRSVGEYTDIVEKETYTFVDRNGEALTLRPEGTAGCVRAVIEHHLLKQDPIQRLWYGGPMFRHERPQKGRHRQFHQIGVEVFGLSAVECEVELLLLISRFWKGLELEDVCGRLEINCLGSEEERFRYKESLVNYFKKYISHLDESSQNRIKKNPLRILDSKEPKVIELLKNAPLISDYWKIETRQKFERIIALLKSSNLAYTFNPYLVRGLDYYTDFVFEWVTHRLGAQGAVCAGGRYDHLVKALGGPATPAVGFAIGLERIILLLKDKIKNPGAKFDVAILSLGEKAQEQGLLLAEILRDQLPGLHVVSMLGGSALKSQLRKADKWGAYWALILGESELEKKEITVKCLREPFEQQSISLKEVIKLLDQHLHKNLK